MYEDHEAWHQHNAHAIVFVTNSLTDLAATVWRVIQEGRRVSMAKFSTAYLHSMRAAKLSYKPLPAFFPCQFRPQAQDMAFGLVRFTLRWAPPALVKTC